MVQQALQLFLHLTRKSNLSSAADRNEQFAADPYAFVDPVHLSESSSFVNQLSAQVEKAQSGEVNAKMEHIDIDESDTKPEDMQVD